jgi:hypothetical protein
LRFDAARKGRFAVDFGAARLLVTFRPPLRILR